MRFDSVPWIQCRDANPTARGIFVRHYSYRPYADGRKVLKFVGPGEYMVLLTHDAKALFVWRKFISKDGQQGVNCAVFRNEGTELSSGLIREALRLGMARWPRQRFYTYVNPRKLSVRKRRGLEYCPWPPGRCFIEAGWQKCGITKVNKLVILEFTSESLQ